MIEKRGMCHTCEFFSATEDWCGFNEDSVNDTNTCNHWEVTNNEIEFAKLYWAANQRNQRDLLTKENSND